MTVFVNQEFSARGSADPLVARTTLQTGELVGAFRLSQDARTELVEIALAVQTRLVACADSADAFELELQRAQAAVGDSSSPDHRFATIPGARDLVPRVDSFLYQAKLAIREIGRLYKPLVGQHFGENFKAFADWARDRWSAHDPLVEMLESDRDWVARVIAMRDAIEHPNHRRGPLTVNNFTLAANGSQILPPSWALGSDRPSPILDEMRVLLDNLLTLFEEVLVQLLMKLDGSSWLEVVEIPVDQREPTMPIRLRVVPRNLPPAV